MKYTYQCDNCKLKCHAMTEFDAIMGVALHLQDHDGVDVLSQIVSYARSQVKAYATQIEDSEMIKCKCRKLFDSVSDWQRHRNSVTEFERSLHEWFKTL